MIKYLPAINYYNLNKMYETNVFRHYTIGSSGYNIREKGKQID